MSTPALVVLPHPDRIAVTAVRVTSARGGTEQDADRLAAALAYLLVRFAGLACTRRLDDIDHAAACLAAGHPVEARSVMGQYRAESAAILTGRL